MRYVGILGVSSKTTAASFYTLFTYISRIKKFQYKFDRSHGHLNVDYFQSAAYDETTKNTMYTRCLVLQLLPQKVIVYTSHTHVGTTYSFLTEHYL